MEPEHIDYKYAYEWVEEYFVLFKDDKTSDGYESVPEDIRLSKRKNEDGMGLYTVIFIPFVLESSSLDIFLEKVKDGTFSDVRVGIHGRYNSDNLGSLMEFIWIVIEEYQANIK